MSYDTALQRVNELRSLTGAGTLPASRGAAAASSGAFDAQLVQQQQSLLGGSAAPAAEAPLSQFGVPVLSVADQYRMLGIEAPMAPGFTPGVGGGAVGTKMVELATRELGVSETTSNNESPRIREYRTATAGAESTPGPWCAYFVSWLAKEAGAPIGAGGNGTGYVPTLEAWGRKEERFVEFGTRPQPGDIVIFDWAGDGVADHTGIVESVGADGSIRTIEGNSSDRVQRRTYAASTNDIRGYVRPG